jgi:hypothetical protein
MIRIKLGLSRIRSGWIAPRFMQVVFYLAHRAGGGGGVSIEPELVTAWLAVADTVMSRMDLRVYGASAGRRC